MSMKQKQFLLKVILFELFIRCKLTQRTKLIIFSSTLLNTLSSIDHFYYLNTWFPFLAWKSLASFVLVEIVAKFHVRGKSSDHLLMHS